MLQENCRLIENSGVNQNVLFIRPRSMSAAKRKPDQFDFSEDEVDWCSSCSTASLKIKLGNGSANCKLCRGAYDRPIPLKGRRVSKAVQNEEEGPDQGAMKKMSNGQYGTMMVWLAKDEMRNIVSGASGSATAGGNKFAQSKAKVVPKKYGYALLAAHINAKHPGSNWTADIAGKKFQYQLGLFSSAKQAQGRSNWGLSQAELSKGFTLQKKLELMCKDFSIWDTWFGLNQKYNPANVQDSSVRAECSGGAVAVDTGRDAEPSGSDEDFENDEGDEGGLWIPTDDTPMDDEEKSMEKGLGFTIQPLSAGVIPDVVSEDRAIPPPPPAIPTHAVTRVGLPSAAANLADKPAKPPTQAQLRRDKANEKSKEMAAIKSQISDAVQSNSASVGNSPKSNFDSTYGDTTRQRIAGNITVEQMRGENAKQISTDTLALGSLRLQFEITSAAEEIQARISIQTEMNVTTLMQNDASGESAMKMMQIMDARRAAAATSQASHFNRLLVQVQNLAPPVAVAPVADLPATVIQVELVPPASTHVIILDDSSASRR
jgi:hypothetical protein